MTIVVLTGLTAEARIFQGAPGLKVLCGSAQRDSLAQFVTNDCDAIVSAGCAGALTPSLRIGALTIGASVFISGDGGTVYPANQDWALKVAAATGGILSPIFSSPTEQAATADQRAALHASFGVDVVDEETWAVAKLAKLRGLPWLALRTISDLSSENLPPADAGATNPDGSTNIKEVIESEAEYPGQTAGLIRDADGFLAALWELKKAWNKIKPAFLLANGV